MRDSCERARSRECDWEKWRECLIGSRVWSTEMAKSRGKGGGKFGREVLASSSKRKGRAGALGGLIRVFST